MTSSSEINHDITEPWSKQIACAILLTLLVLCVVFYSTRTYYSWTLTRQLNLKESQFVAYDLKQIRADEEAALYNKKLPIQTAMDDVVRSYR
jgi:hypothetical protein